VPYEWPQQMPTRISEYKSRVASKSFVSRSPQRSRILVASLNKVQKLLCTDLDRTCLYILISGTYTKFALKNKMLALGICSASSRSPPQALAACLPRQDHVCESYSKPQFHLKILSFFLSFCALDGEHPTLIDVAFITS